MQTFQTTQQFHAYVQNNSNTKQQILAIPVGGNYYTDSALLTACDVYLQDSNNSWTDRADISEYMEVTIMGCDSDRANYNSDRAYVQAYLDCL